MNKIIYSAAVAALINSASAITQKLRTDPDVYGPNGGNYTNTAADYDTSRIGIDITEPGTGPKCKLGDWTTIKWAGYLKDGREITSSNAEGVQPKTFSLGAHEVYKCWDLAIP